MNVKNPETSGQADSFEENLAAFAAPQRLAQLRGKLMDAGRDSLTAQWFTHETPVGPLLVAAADGHVVRVAFERENFSSVEEQLMTRFGTRILRTDHGFESVRTQLEEYFVGTRRAFTVPVDFTLSSGEFRVTVQEQLPNIAYGTTVTYSQLAAASGRPAAVRAAASACATNPLPILVPCHRVVRSDGSTGAYLGGAESKKWLLHHEETWAG